MRFHGFCVQVPFSLDGPSGVLQHIQFLVESQGRAVICVAEGAGQVSGPSCLPIHSRRSDLLQKLSRLQ